MKYIIPMIVGSIIGYFTNWLAIRMLFRPHEEKRILGVRIPFTPGMIPKERGRMAKRVGETVEDYLLRPEKVLEIVLSDDSQAYFQASLESRLVDVKAEDLKLSDLVNRLDLDQERIESEIAGLIIDIITSYLGDSDKELEIISGLESLYDGLEVGLAKVIENNKDSFNIKIEEVLVDYMDKYIKNIDEELSLGEYLDEDLVGDLDFLIEKNRRAITQKTREILLSHRIQLDLLGSVRKLVEENVSRLITTFLPIETIVAKIVETINKYISSEDYESFLLEAMELAKEEVLDLKMGKILNDKSNLFNQSKLEGRILSRLDMIEHLQAIFSSLSKDYKSGIIASSYRRLRNLKDEEDFLEILEGLIIGLLELLGDMKLNIYLDKLRREDIEKLSDKLRALIEEVDPKTLIDIIDRLKISKIVEEEINSFEIDFAEELILDIAERELKAITNLGALLGAILGLLSPLIQYL